MTRHGCYLAPLIFSLILVGFAGYGGHETTYSFLPPTPSTHPIDSLNHAVILKELNPRPVDPTVSSVAASGSVFMNFDDQDLFIKIYFDEKPPIELAYPEKFAGGGRGLRITQAAEKEVYAFCTSEGFFVIDLELEDFSLVDPSDCHLQYRSGSYAYDIRVSPDGNVFAYFPLVESDLGMRDSRFYDVVTRETLSLDEIAAQYTSWLPNWSPNWNYYVEATKVGAGSTEVVIKHRAASEPGNSVLVPREGLSFENWLDDEHLIVRGYTPSNTSSKTDELFLISPASYTVTGLGKHISPDYAYFDSGVKAIRIQPRDETSQDPYRCVLNIIDLATLSPVDIEPAFCRQPADFFVIEFPSRLVYLHSDMPSEDMPLEKTPFVHIVDLDMLTVEALPLEAVNMIVSLSPNNRYLVFVADDLHSAGRTPSFWFGWNDPRLIVFDMLQNQVIYEQSFSAATIPVTQWSLQSNSFVFNAGTEEEPRIFLIMLDPAQSISLSDGIEGTIRWREHVFLARDSQWTSNGTMLLTFTDHEARVIRLSDQTIMPIVETLETEAFAMNVEWYGDNDLILVEAIPRQGDFTTRRWLIDPSLSTDGYPLRPNVQDFGKY